MSGTRSRYTLENLILQMIAKRFLPYLISNTNESSKKIRTRKKKQYTTQDAPTARVTAQSWREVQRPLVTFNSDEAPNLASNRLCSLSHGRRQET